ncbi:uncharacterized protein LOC129909331 [Episyrphus balteatus]|uniref:uncharacterized protein LOC129909331 n=1 Tax=Episyrphus balteatus TaxID=286459 RepID=UPI002486049D|nr:uncharacterized protein LOC129909331 [Episyrphus balteatus]
MFHYIALLTFGLVTLTTAKPLYTTAGSSQLDVRNNYNSGSGYATSIGYASPLQSRIITAASPFAYSAPIARYSPSVLAGPFAYGSPRYESPVLGAGYASPYAAQYASPYASPVFAQVASPYSAAYASPYTIAAPGSSPILL